MNNLPPTSPETEEEYLNKQVSRMVEDHRSLERQYVTGAVECGICHRKGSDAWLDYHEHTGEEEYFWDKDFPILP